MSTPSIGIVAVFYNMAREAPRTLHTLSAQYQQNVSVSDYAIHVIDNGSDQPMSEGTVAYYGKNFQLTRPAKPHPSPVFAINQAVRELATEYVGVLIDGARMLSPGLLGLAQQALMLHKDPIVSTIGFHLGPIIQTKAHTVGYDQDAEDKLLESVDWKSNGYCLFNNSALAGSSPQAWKGRIAESNLIFMRRETFLSMGGFEEGFDYPGGGYANLDFYRRAVLRNEATPILLLGEATFHQIHGGIMANRPFETLSKELTKYQEQYKRIRGEAFKKPEIDSLLYGFFRPEIEPWFQS